jgi:2-oxoglutarate dehydrogenase E2 component (dihydrolipoamide succinyltransferase)
MSTIMDIRAPAEEQAEGTRSQILRWLKGVGDGVAEHEPLLEIETDKVTVEVAAPASGVLREILKAEQEDIVPGDVLGRLEIAGAATSVADDGAGDSRSPLRSAAADPRSPQSPGGLEGASHATQSPSQSASPATPRAVGNVSPAVRRLLEERGLEAASIRGSGPGGRITIDDVLAHAASTSGSAVGASASAARSGAANVPAPKPAQSAPPADAPLARTIPHSAIRKRIAEHMVQSLLHTAPHVTTVFEADMSAVIAHRAAHKADFEKRGAPLTFTAYFLSAAAEAIRAVPEANSRWTDAALEVYDAVNIGVATAIEDVGLVVPVLRGIESRNLFEIARGLNDLVTAARAGKLQPADVRGGTFTISNHGVSGSLLAAPIVINQPQSAILGIGKLEKRVVVEEKNGTEQLIVRPKCYVTLTIDHRVMDGHRANHFLQTFVKALETWPAR